MILRAFILVLGIWLIFDCISDVLNGVTHDFYRGASLNILEYSEEPIGFLLTVSIKLILGGL